MQACSSSEISPTAPTRPPISSPPATAALAPTSTPLLTQVTAATPTATPGPPPIPRPTPTPTATSTPRPETPGRVVTPARPTVTPAVHQPTSVVTGPTASPFPTPAPATVLPRTKTTRTRPPVLDHTDRLPPIASRITIERPEEDGTTRVVGAPGALPGSVDFMVSTLEFHDVPNHIFARSAADGSFDASLFSAPGATLQLRYNPFPSEDSPQEAFGFSPWPGALLRVPDSSQPALGRQFSASGSSGVAWTTEGTVSARDIGPAEPILVTGTLRLFIPEGVTPPPEIVVPLDFGVDLLFDEDGLQTAPGTDFVSRILSPQGLPIERNPGEISSAAVLQSGLVVVNHQGPVMEGDLHLFFHYPD